MTFFDRDLELTEVTITDIMKCLGDKKSIVLNEPFTAELQTGREATITSIIKNGEASVAFLTTNGEIPLARLEVESLLALMTRFIHTKEYTLK